MRGGCAKSRLLRMICMRGWYFSEPIKRVLYLFVASVEKVEGVKISVIFVSF